MCVCLVVRFTRGQNASLTDATPHQAPQYAADHMFLSWARLAWRARGWGVTLVLSTCTWKEVVATWVLVSSSVPPDPRPSCLLLWFSPVTLPLCSSLSPLHSTDLWNHSTAAVLYQLRGTGWCPCAVCPVPMVPTARHPCRWWANRVLLEPAVVQRSDPDFRWNAH